MTDSVYIANLRNRILKAKQAYYYGDTPIMSDAHYDSLEDELRSLDPNDPVLQIVGAPVSPDNALKKAQHSIPMGSQSKVNSSEEFLRWVATGGSSAIHASLKGDGGSAAAYYVDGVLVQAISRGDGMIGEDITANAARFQGLPAWLGDEDGPFTGAIRFEVILTLENWRQVDPEMRKNPRNAGNGIMGRKNGHQSDLLTIYAFDVIDQSRGEVRPFATETEKLSRLQHLGVNVIPHRLCTTAQDAVDYFEHIATTREQLPFWIDGVVMKFDDLAVQTALGVTAGRPKGQVAWKFDSVGAETVIEGVTISGGHTGALIPTAQLRPVEIGGTTVSNVSLANFDEIERLDVAVGDRVWVIKANDIIPKVVRVIDRPSTRQAISRPHDCPFCGGPVARRKVASGEDGAHMDCLNPECPKKSLGKIKRWITSLNILGIGDVWLEAIVEHFDMGDVSTLYTLHATPGELAAVATLADPERKLGMKRAGKLIEEIEAKRHLTLAEFLGSLGIEYLGKRRVQLMIAAAHGELDTLEDWLSGKLRDEIIAERAGVPNMGSGIQDSIDVLAPVMRRLVEAGVTIDYADDAAGAPEQLATQLCISGKLPSGKKKKDYESALAAAGIALVDDVTKDTNFLVLADPESESSKAKKARKLGVAILDESELMRLVGQSDS
jgi:DNA ligase (NAD+)